MIRLDPSPTTPAEERAAWEALIAERDAEIAKCWDVLADHDTVGLRLSDEPLSSALQIALSELAAKLAAYDSVRDVLVRRSDTLGVRMYKANLDGEAPWAADVAELDRLTAALAATEGK